MTYRELYTHPSLSFLGVNRPLEEAKYVILGVPYDSTSTFRSGARFAPNAIREASLQIETYSLEAGCDAEKLPIHDLGDLDVVVDAGETLRRLELVCRELSEMGKRLVLLGGEHSITLGAVRGLKPDALVCFDAHLDLRSEYMGEPLSHASVMRRIKELNLVDCLIWAGVRAVSREELEYANKIGAHYITAREIRRMGAEQVRNKLLKKLEKHSNVYLSIDIDVLDPAYAPAAQNPEPAGLTTLELLELLEPLCGNAAALDVVEVSPNYDNGITALAAAKIVLECLCHMHVKRKT